MSNDSKSRLLELLKKDSVFYGDFALSSGGRSPFYIDCRLTTLNPEGATLVGELLFDLIQSESTRRNTPVNCVGGLTMGADPVALAIGIASFQADAARRNARVDAVSGLTVGAAASADPVALPVSVASFRRSPGSVYQVFTVRKAPKAHGQTKLIEGNFKEGDHVVVIDDVVTKGDSTLRAIEAVRTAGGIVEFAVVLVDRQEGGRQNIESQGTPVFPLFTKSDLIDPAKFPR